MIRLINNWVFTLVEAILLVVFTVLILSLESIFNVLFGVALIIYSLLFVLTKVISYRGIIQMITIAEFFVVIILAIFVIVNQALFPEGNLVNSTVGVAMWFRATTEILHSYHGQGEGREAKRQFNAWKIFVYILLLTLGTYVATNSSLGDDIIRYLIAGISLAAAIIMALLTYTNYRDYRALNPKPVKITATADAPALEESEPEAADDDTDTAEEIVEAEKPEPVEVAKASKKATVDKQEELQVTYEPAPKPASKPKALQPAKTKKPTDTSKK